MFNRDRTEVESEYRDAVQEAFKDLDGLLNGFGAAVIVRLHGAQGYGLEMGNCSILGLGEAVRVIGRAHFDRAEDWLEELWVLFSDKKHFVAGRALVAERSRTS